MKYSREVICDCVWLFGLMTGIIIQVMLQNRHSKQQLRLVYAAGNFTHTHDGVTQCVSSVDLGLLHD
jgi:hypothetical protein